MARASSKVSKKTKRSSSKAAKSGGRKKSAPGKPASAAKAATKTKKKQKKKKSTSASRKSAKATTKKKATAKRKTAKKTTASRKPKKASSSKKRAAKKTAGKKSVGKKSVGKTAASSKKTAGKKKSKAKATQVKKAGKSGANASRRKGGDAARPTKAKQETSATAQTMPAVKSGGLKAVAVTRLPRKIVSTRGSRRVDATQQEQPKAKRIPKSKLGKRKLNEYKEMLLRKRLELTGNVRHLTDHALHRTPDQNKSDSSMPIHMADVGSDNWEQEFTLGLLAGERELVREIDAALQRIVDGTYGICLATHQPIQEARLQAKPWARFCIEYARQLEQGSSQ